MQARVALVRDVSAVTETIALAFRSDPVWGPALERPDGDTAHLTGFWRLFVEGALRYSTVYTDESASAVAVWLPPGAEELSAGQRRELDVLIAQNLEPERAQALDALWERFERARAQAPLHMYLSLLATHPERRGHGIGQALLADNLARFDADGLPAYLESTNPANDHRYARAGFRPLATFPAVLDDAPVTTMWREPPFATDV